MKNKNDVLEYVEKTWRDIDAEQLTQRDIKLISESFGFQGWRLGKELNALVQEIKKEFKGNFQALKNFIWPK